MSGTSGNPEWKSKGDVAATMVAGGWNCAQSVLGVFCAELGLDRETAMKLASAFGAGLARKGEVCGAVSGAVMAIGLQYGQAREDDREAKEKAYRLGREAMDRFQDEFGSCLCRELLPGLDLATDAGQERFKAEGWSERVCQPCVRGAVRILEAIL